MGAYIVQLLCSSILPFAGKAMSASAVQDNLQHWQHPLERSNVGRSVYSPCVCLLSVWEVRRNEALRPEIAYDIGQTEAVVT